MKIKLYIILLLPLFTLVYPSESQAQYQTSSKTCGKCNKPVSVDSKVGMRCPHCGVRWGTENTSYQTEYKYYNTYGSDYYSGSSSKIKRNGSYVNVNRNSNLRTEPNTSGRIRGFIKEGNQVKIIKKKESWYYISYNGCLTVSKSKGTFEGWIMEDYVELFLGEYKTTDLVKLRTCGDVSCKEIGMVHDATVLDFISWKDGWYHVKFDGTIYSQTCSENFLGWVHESNIE